MLEFWKKAFESNRLRFSQSKTAYELLVSGYESRDKDNSVPQCDKFQYLGSITGEDEGFKLATTNGTSIQWAKKRQVS